MTVYPPNSSVTFLFTDIEGSTQLWERFPELMPAALRRHDTVLKHCVETAGGRVVKNLGDGVHAVFDQAPSAVKAVIAGQEALLAEQWGEWSD